MEQYVDFYRKLDESVQIPKPVIYVLGSWLSVFTVYVIWYLALVIGQDGIENSIQMLATNNQNLQHQIDERAKQGLLSGEKALLKKIKNLQIERHEKQQLATLLNDPKNSNLEGFSRIFVSLARQHQQGLSLQKIEVTASGTEFFMAGNVSRGGLVPAYLARLGGERVFQNMAFKQLKITEEIDPNVAGKPTELKFEVRSLTKI